MTVESVYNCKTHYNFEVISGLFTHTCYDCTWRGYWLYPRISFRLDHLLGGNFKYKVRGNIHTDVKYEMMSSTDIYLIRTRFLPRGLNDRNQPSRHGTLRYFVSIQTVSYFPEYFKILSRPPNNTSQYMWIVINTSESQNGVKLDWRNMGILLLCIKIINFVLKNQNPKNFRLL